MNRCDAVLAEFVWGPLQCPNDATTAREVDYDPYGPVVVHVCDEHAETP